MGVQEQIHDHTHLYAPGAVYACVKRAMDLTVAIILLATSAPVLVVAAVAIKLSSPGPVFFRQHRLGRHGKPFTILKLRTMHVSQASATEWAAASRLELKSVGSITAVGRLLRRLSVDELPQLWNVIRGQMSVVGPRPHSLNPSEREFLENPWRLAMRPGLTNLWAVSGRASLTRAEELALDRSYLERRSLVLDMKILLKTPMAIIGGHGAG